MKNIMPTTIHKTLLGTTMFAFAVLATTNLALAADDCFVTEDTLDHIYPRHCSSVVYQDKSKFLPGYCANVTTAQLFCEMVQNAYDRRKIVQNDHRIRYEANFGFSIGTNREECAVMVIVSEANGEVVTQYPQFC